MTVFTPVDTAPRKDLGIRAGDTVRVYQKIKEKGKTRLQVFEGIVLATKHGSEAGGTFTVRRVASGVGVEKTFPLYSPMIDKIEIARRSKVRRAKLYYIREKVAREIRRQMRRMQFVNLSTESGTEEGEEAAPTEEAETADAPQEETEESAPEEVHEESPAEVPAQEEEKEQEKK